MADVELLEETKTEDAPFLPRMIWSGSVSIVPVNIPVKALAITKKKSVSFHLLHRSCKTRISCRRFCQEGDDEVLLSDIVCGYPIQWNRYMVLNKKEIEQSKPESENRIRLDRFVNFFKLDAHCFDITYLLVPNQSEEAYVLLKNVLELTGRAGIGKTTISSREHEVLVHYYQNAIIVTTLRYPDEVLNPRYAR